MKCILRILKFRLLINSSFSTFPSFGGSKRSLHILVDEVSRGLLRQATQGCMTNTPIIEAVLIIEAVF